MDQLKQIALIAIIVVISALWFRSCQQARQDMRQFENNIKISRDSIKHFKDKSGQLVGRVQSMVLNANQLQEQGALLQVDVNRLKGQVGSLTNLVGYYKGELVAKGIGQVKGKDTTIYVVDKNKDTTKVVAKAFNFENGFLRLRQVLSPIDSVLRIEYSYRVNFELTNYRTKRKWLIAGPRQTFADVRLSDPNASMMVAQSIQIEAPPKKFYEQTWFIALVGFIGGEWVLSKFR